MLEEQPINDVCPWSGKPVRPDSLTRYRGHLIGFCNPGCRDKFRNAIALFDGQIDGDHAPSNAKE